MTREQLDDALDGDLPEDEALEDAPELRGEVRPGTADLVTMLEAQITVREIELDALRKARDVLAGKGLVPATKVCSGCELEKPSSAFAKNMSQRDRLQSVCRACMSIRKAKTRDKLPADIAEAATRAATEIVESNERHRRAVASAARAVVGDAPKISTPPATPLALPPRPASASPAPASCRDENCRKTEVHPAHGVIALSRQQKLILAGRERARTARRRLICHMPDPANLDAACGAEVMSHKASQHAYEVHKQHLGQSDIPSHFEEAPRQEDEASA